MSKLFLTSLNLSGNELQNVNLQNLAAAPSGPAAGRAYFDTTIGAGRVYNGSGWAVLDATKASGIPTTAISGFQSTVQGYALNSFAAPTANVAMAGFTLTALPAPTGPGQPAEYSWTLGQIQSAAAGISSKSPVKAVSTVNIATLSGTLTVDAVALNAGDRVLLMAQTTASQNGVWVIAAGSWTRPVTEGATAELDIGATWLALQGAVNAGTQWRMSNTGAITVGTTSITIVQFSVGSSYVAGNGLTGTSTFTVQAAPSGNIVVTSSGVDINTAQVARTYKTTIGDGTNTSYTITHNLGTQDVAVVCRVISSQSSAEVDWSAITTNTVTITVTSPLAANSLRVLVLG